MPITDFPTTWDEAEGLMHSARRRSLGKPLRGGCRLIPSTLSSAGYRDLIWVGPMDRLTIYCGAAPLVSFYPCGLVKIWPRHMNHGRCRWKLRRILRYRPDSTELVDYYYFNWIEPQYVMHVPSTRHDIARILQSGNTTGRQGENPPAVSGTPADYVAIGEYQSGALGGSQNSPRDGRLSGTSIRPEIDLNLSTEDRERFERAFTAFIATHEARQYDSQSVLARGAQGTGSDRAEAGAGRDQPELSQPIQTGTVRERIEEAPSRVETPSPVSGGESRPVPQAYNVQF